MRVLFFGIYDIGLQALRCLVRDGHEVVGVVTKPETPSDPQPVRRWADGRLPVLEPQSPREPAFVATVRELRPDLIVVAGYHRIIPEAVLSIPTWGAVNLHGSLLPEYRGPCTWKWAIINGEASTGVTVHVMTPELDNGDLLAQEEIPILPDETGGDLFARISRVGGELVSRVVAAIRSGEAVRTPQDESRATYFGYPTERESQIDWEAGAERVRNLVRGLAPRPGAWTAHGDRRFRVGAARVLDTASGAPAGTVLGFAADGLVVATSTSDVVLLDLVPEGDPPAPVGVAPGERLRARPEPDSREPSQR